MYNKRVQPLSTDMQHRGIHQENQINKIENCIVDISSASTTLAQSHNLVKVKQEEWQKGTTARAKNVTFGQML